MWSFMNYEFTSIDELFDRVKPALHAKEVEFLRLGYKNVKYIDIWKYLIESKWRYGKNLMLSEIVNDILHADIKKINEYLKNI